MVEPSFTLRKALVWVQLGTKSIWLLGWGWAECFHFQLSFHCPAACSRHEYLVSVILRSSQPHYMVRKLFSLFLFWGSKCCPWGFGFWLSWSLCFILGDDWGRLKMYFCKICSLHGIHCVVIRNSPGWGRCCCCWSINKSLGEVHVEDEMFTLTICW